MRLFRMIALTAVLAATPAKAFDLAELFGHHQVRHSTPLLDVAKRYVGSRNFTGLRAPWCMAGLRVWLTKAGYRDPRSNRAIDGLRIGRPSAPKVGAVAVMRHHVGIVAAFTPRGPLILSANHNHRVGYGVYPARRIIAYRAPN